MAASSSAQAHATKNGLADELLLHVSKHRQVARERGLNTSVFFLLYYIQNRVVYGRRDDARRGAQAAPHQTASAKKRPISLSAELNPEKEETQKLFLFSPYCLLLHAYENQMLYFSVLLYYFIFGRAHHDGSW